MILKTQLSALHTSHSEREAAPARFEEFSSFNSGAAAIGDKFQSRNLGEALRNSHGLKERAQAPVSILHKSPSDRPKVWHPLPWATTAGRASLLAPEVSWSVRREEPGGERVMFTSFGISASSVHAPSICLPGFQTSSTLKPWQENYLDRLTACHAVAMDGGRQRLQKKGRPVLTSPMGDQSSVIHWFTRGAALQVQVFADGNLRVMELARNQELG
ncbi:uncharacterized protein BDZ83DRAFT_648721 [Colletotrichum acutatum]|uniref:Uncharacterized protein n=1 Tax=Glomerella acutata TaxID=27357 RepID=A0AAD8XHQ2_GLOAC|nr:uncharacterized protein BDZ83DRAFT_648721 [Colletotrichum acutatum]KAK1728459.1 hypothetical protein BDZ83DRAFT_648721 [Colletotrichum acutatum]